MSGDIIRQDYELECIGPVHTGSGETYKAFEYLYNFETREAAFPNERRWIDLLDRHGLIDPFIAYVRKGAFGFDNLREWLLTRGVTEEELSAVAARRAVADPLTDGDKDTLNDIISQTILADGRPYIPGSSIKGALRTGILYGLISRDPKKYRSVWQDCKRVIENPRWKKKEFQKIMQDLEIQLLHTLRVRGARHNAVVSAMRGLRVGDAVCAEGETDTVILRKLDATTGMDEGAGESKVSLFRECIPAGRRLRFSITVDRAMLSTLGIRSLDEIIAMAHTCTADGLRRQESVFGRRYPEVFADAARADILIGGGTGFLAKTLIYALADSDNEAQNFIKTALDSMFRAHKHRQYDRAISPRTLKLARMDTQDWLMGLCSITGVGNAQTL